MAKAEITVHLADYDTVKEVVAERDRLRGLLLELVDPDPCRYDHDDCCQTHTLGERPCPHERAKKELGRGD